jgi:hypothetical protein
VGSPRAELSHVHIVCYLGSVLLAVRPRSKSYARRFAGAEAWTRRAALTSLTLIAFIVSAVVGMVHDATSLHVQCAEHGELIHREAAAAPQLDSSPDALLGAVPVRSVAPAHEHCALASAMRGAHEAARPCLSIVQRLETPQPAAPPVERGATTALLFRTAPKTSPPA